MNSIADIERNIWKEIQAAIEKREAGKLAHLSTLADEIELKKKDWLSRLEKGPTGLNPRTVAPSGGADADFTGRPIKSFVLDGTEVPVSTYKELLVRLTTLLRKKHSDEFDRRALSLGGRKRRYFSRDPRVLKYAHELEPGGLFAETNLNANLIVKICYAIVRELGYLDGSLSLR